MSIRDNIIDLMREKLYKPMLKEELAEVFEIGRKELKVFYKVINSMEKEGIIVKTRSDRYGLPEKMNLVVGILDGTEKKFGFVVPEEKGEEDIFIPADSINGALNGDKVIVRITRKKDEDKREEGEIIRILERANKEIVGTFEDNKNFGFVVPDDRRINVDIFIPKAYINGAKTNQKVVVEVLSWGDYRRSPEGKITEILGYTGEKGTDILSIIKQYKLPEEFPNNVISQAQAIPQEIEEREIERRLDLREKNIFTIDGEDAKDFDDAVSVEKMNNGNFLLGVHIADVTHYVKENSPLDKEALKRGTSVYLIDRVIPMLPLELSNGICSLNPNVDRLTLSVFMEIDNNGNIVDHKIQESVIRSKKRLVYDDISDLLEKGEDHIVREYKDIYEDLKNMEKLCYILRDKRELRGSIDFDFPETKIILDGDGKPVDIKKDDRRIANRIIEEFMLACNETVAEDMTWADIPFVYRIHENPDSEKIGDFNKFIHNFGYNLKGNQEIHPKELQELLKKIEGKKEEALISNLMLRSLKKARYSNKAEGHFGLAAKYYCHFTSPIRRYPDLQIHRIIKSYINGRLTPDKIQYLEKRLPMVADQSSGMEKIADEAERDVDDLKKAEYMSKRIGSVYEGMVSSLTHFGMFVQLDNTIEGLIHFSNMVDDYYYFDDDKYCIVGERTHKIYRIGDMVKIKVIGADVVRRSVDFVLTD